MGSDSIPELRPPQPALDARALDRSLVHGIAWTSAAPGLGCDHDRERLITRKDSGLVGMGSIYLGLITLVSEFRLGFTVLTLRDPSEEQVAQLHRLGAVGDLASVLLPAPRLRVVVPW